MSNYNSVTPEFIDELKTLLGEKYVKTDADTLDRYKTDEEADERCFHLPDVVVIPANAEEIAGVVKLCNKYLIPLTVRGGGTGIVDGAIADKGQIYQLIQGFNRGDRIYALVAPAFINQFPGLASTGKLKAALKALGFCDVVEVAIGADLCTVDEAHDFLEEVPGKLNFMATSCCPAWSMMAKTAFPDLAKNISMTMTPMVFTARMMKQADPEARMCFIGPCAAKKLEASRRTVRSDVDFVLTFEELAGIIEAKDIDVANLEVDPDEIDLVHASGAGRGFAQSGGVAKAVADKIKEWHPDMDVKIASAQGLAECKKLLMLAKAGKYNGYLLEGMGCPGGCIGGAGTIADPTRTAVALNKYVKEAPFQDPEQSAFMTSIHVLKDDPDFEV